MKWLTNTVPIRAVFTRCLRSNRFSFSVALDAPTSLAPVPRSELACRSINRYARFRKRQTLQRVTSDFETRWHFNSAIALIMELTNEIYAQEPLEEGVRPEIRKEVLELLTLMLAPMTPHLAEELWEMLGHKEGQWTVAWPSF